MRWGGFKDNRKKELAFRSQQPWDSTGRVSVGMGFALQREADFQHLQSSLKTLLSALSSAILASLAAARRSLRFRSTIINPPLTQNQQPQGSAVGVSPSSPSASPVVATEGRSRQSTAKGKQASKQTPSLSLPYSIPKVAF